ncbi:conserved hypothetical protein, secreted [Candidatus Magnetomorum sp. HK-1]|nr:conserved hypothetical protein, secreted [Candidatus Magnetomorum sp. HK-1]
MQTLIRINFKTLVITAISWLIFFGLSTALYAQSDNLRFELVLSLGIPIYDFTQDQDGFFWFAADHGLLKYDGVNIKSYHKGPNSISSDYVRAVLDTNDALWIGSNGGVDKFDKKTGTFTHYDLALDDPTSLNEYIFTILKDTSGVLWIGTENRGLGKLDEKTKTFTFYTHNPDDPTSLSDKHVKVIYEDTSGVLWVGTHYKGLNKYNKDRFGVDLRSDQAKHYKLRWLKKILALIRPYIRFFRPKKSDIEILKNDTKFLTKSWSGQSRST